ncbi:hypothetical protein N7499_003399 [Penicillium canescens]|uniref:Uncharacterized protein n=1 Tax=Penicillium canescens TaxID=5083 RepID=A0AAD6I911_PENCN|nr:uncharacterized protein N7446_012323 [Penicillium canescens]KAJ6020102.1 hypothetical protein N7522_000177 [Penicillium canescens]KAJ6038048.1 hypothetical protein N7460_007819 [Penicillium canescens]KAJ6045459.1 hypothetical protein N7446_012323 [Penicillium canescens]KAJ6061138.1 hypothetical protein N7444_001834 [Penicillium canescens]KAJ6090685.1 hypothetical protein N7499_003399 [Penicillium canescens]
MPQMWRQVARGTTTVTSRTQPTETISFPVLTYSDALPRNDLRDLDDQPSKRLTRAGIIGQWDFRQPSPVEGWFRRPPPGPGANFDFQVTSPPDEVIPSSNGPTEQYMIGVALGSPGMINEDEPLPPPRFDTAIFEPERMTQSPQAYKQSKWKKIGGLFKAKNALTSPSNRLHGSLAQQPENSNKPKERNNSLKEWPAFEVDPKATMGGVNQSPPRSRKFSLSVSKAPPEEPPVQRPLLSVDIPDIRMERYSVMFSDVVNKNERPSLLARRAKTLDNLRVPDANGFLKAPAPPPMPQRRATSPARSSFTLFPSSQPSKAARLLGTQNFSRGPGPLIRSNTLPVESPSKASANHSRNSSNINSTSLFESPVIPRLNERSSSNTPRSPSSLDKPLPAIKHEPQASHQQRIVQPPKNILLDQTLLTLFLQGRINSHGRLHIHQEKTLNRRQVKSHPRLPRHRSKVHITVSTTDQTTTNKTTRPDHVSESKLKLDHNPQSKTIPQAAHLSPPSTLNATHQKIDRIMSPASASPATRLGISAADSTRLPFADADGAIEINENEEPESEQEPPRAIPRVEVSIARSILDIGF